MRLCSECGDPIHPKRATVTKFGKFALVCGPRCARRRKTRLQRLRRAPATPAPPQTHDDSI